MLAAVSGAGDLDAARLAATHAQQRSAAGWRDLAGDVLYTAASESGAHLTGAVQAHPAGAGVADYKPDAVGHGPSAVTPWVDANTRQLAKAVTAHTRTMLAARLADASLTASSTDDLNAAINDLYDQWTGLGAAAGSGDYAGQLAGDWTAAGWNHGAWDAAVQLAGVADGGDIGVERTWVTVGDDKVRPEHAAAEGQTVGLNDPFTVGGESLMYPADISGGSVGNTINCRCSIDYAVSVDDASGADAADIADDAEDDGEGA